MSRHLARPLGLAALVAISTAAVAARAGDPYSGSGSNSYQVTPLVSDLVSKTKGVVHDPVLQNAWGVAFSPGASPFWIADNATGCSTLYDGDGTIVPLQVKIPLPPAPGMVPSTACVTVNPKKPPSPTPAAPTGLAWNPSSAFLVPGTTKTASFIFDTEDGTLSAWTSGLTPANAAVLAVDNSKTGPGAVYKGLVFGTNAKGVFLFATNFRAGTIDVFAPAPSTSSTGLYVPQATDGSFKDPKIPAGFAPFGIQNINGDLFVTYAKQNAQKHDDVAGPGNGFVDVFDTDGHLLRRFASRGALNSPWGLARASYAFGRFSGDVLVGDFGDGRVNVYDFERQFPRSAEGPQGQAAGDRRAVDLDPRRRRQIELGHALFHRRPERRDRWPVRHDHPDEETVAARNRRSGSIAGPDGSRTRQWTPPAPAPLLAKRGLEGREVLIQPDGILAQPPGLAGR